MTARLILGDCLEVLRTLPASSVHCCVTSPPYYGLRDYGVSGQIGLEKTPGEYISRLVAVFEEVRRVLRKDGSLWVNIGDSYCGGGGFCETAPSTSESKSGKYGSLGALKSGGIKPFAGMKPKDLLGIPWMLAFALRDAGWYLRSEIIWHKPNPMPESVTDRPTKAHEQLFLLAKSKSYFYDAEAIAEPSFGFNGSSFTSDYDLATKLNLGDGPRNERASRNRRSVWTIATEPFSGAMLLADYVGDDGRPYTASPDCPRHGHLASHRSQRTDVCGERSDRLGSDIHSIVAGLSSKPLDAHASKSSMPNDMPVQGSLPPHTIESTGESKTPVQNQTSRVDGQDGGAGKKSRNSRKKKPSTLPACGKDLSPHGNAETASARSNENRKTDRVASTNQPYTASAQTENHTGDTEESRESGELFGHTPESSSGLDDQAVHASEQIAESILHKPWFSYHHGNTGKCTCQVVKVDHFATYPTKLIEPCILAGTSAEGCCAECGAPRRRIVEREQLKRERPNDYVKRVGEDGTGNSCANSVAGVSVKTIGWEPSCKCGATSVPCTVLDPFMGSGTTGEVALRHGRDFIGIELSAEYMKLADRRIGQIKQEVESEAKFFGQTG